MSGDLFLKNEFILPATNFVDEKRLTSRFLVIKASIITSQSSVAIVEFRPLSECKIRRAINTYSLHIAGKICSGRKDAAVNRNCRPSACRY